MYDSIRIMKTWTNAWCTSDRFHETVRLPCLFGCNRATDKQAHYIMCPFLYAIQKFLWAPTAEIHDDPLPCLALRDTCLDSLKLVACTFSGYHHLKFTYARRFHDGGNLDPKSAIPHTEHSSFLRSFAEVFRAEAIELGCRTRCFDPALFNSYLLGQSALADQSDGDVQAHSGPAQPGG